MVESSRTGAEMEWKRVSPRRTLYSFRHRSRGAAPKESSGILDVEHIRNTSIREKFAAGSCDRGGGQGTGYASMNTEQTMGKVAGRSSDESLEEGDECNQKRTSRVKPEYKVSEEMIWVSVPRRARSACAKGPQESFAVLRHSSCSSPSSNASMKSKGEMKPSPTNNRPSKMSKASISESEAEVAQFLCRLKKLHSQHYPAKSENFQSAQLDFSSHLSDEGYVSIVSISTSLASTPISLPLSSQSTYLSNHSIITPETGTVPKGKKPRHQQLDDAEKPSVMIACSPKPNEDSIEEHDTNSLHALSTIEDQEDKNLHITKVRTSLPKLEKEALPNGNVYFRIASPQVPQSPTFSPLQVDEEPNSINPVYSKLLMSEELKQKSDSDFLKDDGCSGANFQAALEQTNQMLEKEENLSKQNLPSPSSLDDKLDAHHSISPLAASAESVKSNKFEVVLMAPPVNTSPNSTGHDALVDNPQVSQNNHGHVTCESHDKSKVIANHAEKMTMQGPKAKRQSDIIEWKEKSQMKKEATEVAISVKQPFMSGKIRSCHDEHNQNKVNMMQNPQKAPEDTTSPTDRMGQSTGIRTSTSTPILMKILVWPGHLPPFGILISSGDWRESSSA